MRARVRTLGVEEHHFVIEKGKPSTFSGATRMLTQFRTRCRDGCVRYGCRWSSEPCEFSSLGVGGVYTDVRQACKMGTIF
jgi:hypothetical protein